jgi:hypothetical protein
MATSGVAAFATTHRMGNRVHRGSANSRANTLPAVPSRLTNHHAAMLTVADHADGCPAGAGNTSDFAAGKRDLSPPTFAGVECGPMPALRQS